MTNKYTVYKYEKTWQTKYTIHKTVKTWQTKYTVHKYVKTWQTKYTIHKTVKTRQKYTFIFSNSLLYYQMIVGMKPCIPWIGLN